jgi:hypothetical protein
MPAWLSPRSAAVTGGAHAASGAGCEDHVRTPIFLDALGRRTAFIAVADGAGSAPKAKIGAQLATLAAAQQARTQLRSLAADAITQEHALEWGEAAHRKLARQAERDGESIEAYHSTMLLALLAPSHVILGHIGDGAIVGRHDGQWRTLSAPFKGEWPGETVFITLPNWRDYYRTGLIDGSLDSIAVFTDGLDAAIFGLKQEPHAPQMDALVDSHARLTASAFERALHTWLNCEAVQRQSHDDRTIAIAMRA